MKFLVNDKTYLHEVRHVEGSRELGFQRDGSTKDCIKSAWYILLLRIPRIIQITKILLD